MTRGDVVLAAVGLSMLVTLAQPGGAPPAGSDPGMMRRVVTRDAAAADLRAWGRTVSSMHPALSDDSARARVISRLDRLVRRLPPWVDALWLQHEWSQVAASLADSHTTVRPRPEFSDHPRLPVVVQGDQVCLSRPVAHAPEGSCFVQFADVPASRVAAWVAEATSHETGDGWRVHVEGALPFALTALGVGPSARVVYRRPDGALRSMRLPGVGEVEAPPVSNAVQFGVDARGIGVLVLRTLDGTHAEFFDDAFARVFRSLAEQGARGLIVDLRGNDGGSTTVAEALLDAVAVRPYRTMSEKHWRVSAPMQAEIREKGGEDSAYVRAPSGVELLSTVAPHVPQTAYERFEGPVLFLCDRRTRSSAMMMLDAIGSYHLGMIVGEAPASPPNYFGEVYRYTAANTGLSLTVSTARFVRASGDGGDMSLVEPDITLPDFPRTVAGRERALAKARGILELWLFKLEAPGEQPSSDPRGLDEGVQ